MIFRTPVAVQGPPNLRLGRSAPKAAPVVPERHYFGSAGYACRVGIFSAESRYGIVAGLPEDLVVASAAGEGV